MLSRFAAVRVRALIGSGAGRIVGGRSQHEELLGRSSEPLKRVVSVASRTNAHVCMTPHRPK